MEEVIRFFETYHKFFPMAEESIDYYNKKRCIDGKGLILPSQIRYVKYVERILQYFNGENQPDRRCMLRGVRLLRCPYWIRLSITVSNHDGILFSMKKHARTKDLSPEDIWFSAPKKGVMVFALLREPGLTELAGDFKIYFHDRQGDFDCWLNTTMIENRKILDASDLDGFDKRKIASPGFQVEVVLMDFDSNIAFPNPPSASSTNESTDKSLVNLSTGPAQGLVEDAKAEKGPNKEKDDELSDPEVVGSASSKYR